MTKKQKERFKNVKIEYGNDEYRRDRAMNTLARNIARLMIDDGFRPEGFKERAKNETSIR